MTLPIRATLEDITHVCHYFSKKPTGATLKEASTVLEKRTLDGRKINALKVWGLLVDVDDKLKITERGRIIAKGEEKGIIEVFKDIIKDVPAYYSVVERAAHRNEKELDLAEIGSHWHEHFTGELADSEKTIHEQVMCFFQAAHGAKLGSIILGRRGLLSRFSFDQNALAEFSGFGEAQAPAATGDHATQESAPKEEEGGAKGGDGEAEESTGKLPELGKGIFIAHGKNKKPLEQLKKILTQFKIPFKVVIEEPNRGRPISTKVRDTMQECNCAILIFTADEELFDKENNTIWRPSENVVYELGAVSFLYEDRVVILKEESVSFPSNFSEIGYIPFDKDNLDAKSMDILKELIEFGIVKFTT